MCPWESRCIAVLGADKCHGDENGGTMTGLSNLRLSNMCFALKGLKQLQGQRGVLGSEQTVNEKL